MADKTFTEGSGITKRTIVSEPLDNDAAFDRLCSDARAMFEFPSYTRELAEWARRNLEGMPPQGRERPREDPRWYLREILMQLEIATKHIEKGDASGAACAAMRLGETFCELRMKWNDFDQGRSVEDRAMTGIKVASGGQSSRQGAQAERVADVDRIAKEIGRGGKRAAFGIVAERVGVTAGAIQKDYYKAKKDLSQRR